MHIHLIGTGAGGQTLARRGSAVLITDGPLRVLIDCGPGTLGALIAGEVPDDVAAICLTHGHPDHYGDLVNVLAHWGYHRSRPLAIVAPEAMLEDVRHDVARLVATDNVAYPVTVLPATVAHEALPATHELRAFPTDHTVPSVGYRLAGPTVPGGLRHEYLDAVGVPPGARRGALRRGESVTADDGTLVTPAMATLPPTPGAVVVVTGDTRRSDLVAEAAKGADVLVHDATYRTAEAAHAARWAHSTARDAGEVAAAAEVRLLVLTHLSARYADNGRLHVEEALEAFHGDVIAGNDKLCLEIAGPARRIRVTDPGQARFSTIGWSAGHDEAAVRPRRHA